MALTVISLFVWLGIDRNIFIPLILLITILLSFLSYYKIEKNFKKKVYSN